MSWDYVPGKNAEGYPDPTAGRAIWKADKPPEEVINFRRAMKLMSVICHVRQNTQTATG